MPITIPTVDQILGDLQNRFQQFFGVDNFNIAPSTPNGQLVRIWTHALYQSYQTLQYAYQSSRYNQAIGADLDNLLSLLGIVRRNGNVTFNAVALTGEPNATVPAGALAATNTGAQDFLFYLTADVVLDENGQGTGVFVQEFNQQLTTNSFTAGQLNQVVSIIKNTEGIQIWTGVNNPNPSQTIGQLETDDSLRRRSSLFISRFSAGYLSTIRSAVLTTPGCRNVQVYENLGGTSAGFPPGLPLHNILVIGYWVPAPTSGSDLATQIATQIGEVMPPTTAWDGTPNVGEDQFKEMITLPTGQELSIGFVTAVQKKFGVWVYLEETSNLTETTNRILNFLWRFFDNPGAFSNGGEIDSTQTRGRPIGSFLNYQDFQCAIRELGSDGLFKVENIWITNDWRGSAAATNWSMDDIASTTFDDVLLFNNEQDPMMPPPEGSINAPQLTIAFQAANGTTTEGETAVIGN